MAQAKKEFTNPLVESSSPYLRQHAHNPVFWQEWGEKAITQAREQDKPILLSIGYSTCYWCHVMEREVFANPSIAATMNDNFVCIKLDREEYPDLDEIYMLARQMMTQEGGWPNNLFLTPELKPWFGGGTYGPKRVGEQPGFPEILDNLTKHWKEDREKIEDYANQVTVAMQDYFSREKQIEKQPVSEQRLGIGAGQLFSELSQHHDIRAGGFYQGAKFPHETYLLFLLAYFKRTRNTNALAIATNTLHKMAAGGIYDHVGAGFHRYAIDTDWLVPHFEKMLYNQALLALAYTRHHAMTNDPYTMDIARSVLEFVCGPMRSPTGAFYTGIDAETDGVEGAYYTWTPQEMEQLLTKPEIGFFLDVYNMSDVPVHKGQKHPGGRVISAEKPLPEAAAERGLRYLEVAASSAMLFNRMLVARNSRKAPQVDYKLLTGLNGLMIAALSEGATIFRKPRYLEAARGAADFLLKNAKLEDGTLARYHDGENPHLAAQLEDYSYFVYGLIALSVALDTPEGDVKASQHYLEEAARLMVEAKKNLWDNEDGAFFNAISEGDRIVRMKSMEDNATPCPNAMMLHNMVSLAELTKDSVWHEWAIEHEAALMHRAMGSEVMLEYATLYAASLRLHPDAETSDKKDVVLMPKHPTDVLNVESRITKAAKKEGEESEIAIDVTISEGWYLHGGRTLENSLMPLMVDIRGVLVEKVGDIAYPETKDKEFPYADGPLPVLEGKFTVTAKAVLRKKPGKDADPDQPLLEAYVSAQPCMASACLEPIHVVAIVEKG